MIEQDGNHGRRQGGMEFEKNCVRLNQKRLLYIASSVEKDACVLWEYFFIRRDSSVICADLYYKI